MSLEELESSSRRARKSRAPRRVEPATEQPAAYQRWTALAPRPLRSSKTDRDPERLWKRWRKHLRDREPTPGEAKNVRKALAPLLWCARRPRVWS
ncbi:MAG: hypothetical protein QM811_29010 [Pirellulales bacterium]